MLHEPPSRSVSLTREEGEEAPHWGQGLEHDWQRHQSVKGPRQRGPEKQRGRVTEQNSPRVSKGD